MLKGLSRSMFMASVVFFSSTAFSQNAGNGQEGNRNDFKNQRVTEDEEIKVVQDRRFRDIRHYSTAVDFRTASGGALWNQGEIELQARGGAGAYAVEASGLFHIDNEGSIISQFADIPKQNRSLYSVGLLLRGDAKGNQIVNRNGGSIESILLDNGETGDRHLSAGILTDNGQSSVSIYNAGDVIAKTGASYAIGINIKGDNSDVVIAGSGLVSAKSTPNANAKNLGGLIQGLRFDGKAVNLKHYGKIESVVKGHFWVPLPREAHGVYSTGDDFTADIHGTITSRSEEGGSSNGIYASGNNARITLHYGASVASALHHNGFVTGIGLHGNNPNLDSKGLIYAVEDEDTEAYGELIGIDSSGDDANITLHDFSSRGMEMIPNVVARSRNTNSRADTSATGIKLGGNRSSLVLGESSYLIADPILGSAVGIFVTGSDSRLRIDGKVNVSSLNSGSRSGISIFGNNVSLEGRGDIQVTGYDGDYVSRGLVVDGAGFRMASPFSGKISVSKINKSDINDASVSGLYLAGSDPIIYLGQQSIVEASIEGKGNAYGIQTLRTARNARIDNAGHIKARVKGSSPSDAFGMFLEGEGNGVHNTGKIESSGIAVRFTGKDGFIRNTGRITSDLGAYLIGGASHVFNAGTLDAPNIAVFYDRGKAGYLENSGIIRAQGTYAIEGMASFIHVDNFGLLEAAGTAIKYSKGGMLENSGTIIAQGTYAIGGTGFIHVNNSGRVEAAGTAIEYSEGGMLENSGTIIAQGTYAIGGTGFIHVNNSGRVEAAGTAIQYGGSGSVLENSGIIRARGAYAVRGTAPIRVANSGSIIGSVQDKIPAIFLEKGGTLELNKGSVIIGDIILGGDTNVRIDFAAQQRSAHWKFAGDGIFTLGDMKGKESLPHNVFRGGREVALLNTTGLQKAGEFFWSTLSNISGLIQSRRFIDVSESPKVWATGFKSRSVGENVLEGVYRGASDQQGFVLGFDGQPLISDWSVGVFGGYQKDGMHVRYAKSLPVWEAESSGVFGVVHAYREFENIFVHAALSAGWLSHEDQRYFDKQDGSNGIATSLYNSYWIAPEVTVGLNLEGADEWFYRPVASLGYGIQSFGASTEEGASLPATYGNRSVSLISAAMGIEAIRGFDEYDLILRGGIRGGMKPSVTSEAEVILAGEKKSFQFGNFSRAEVYSGAEIRFRAEDVDFNLSGDISIGGNKANLQIRIGAMSFF